MRPRFRLARPFSRWKLRPVQGEAATSYFARLVREQAATAPATYAHALGLRSGKSHAADVLKSVTSLPISESERAGLLHWTPVAQKKGLCYGGNLINENTFKVSRRLHCASCVAEAAYHRSWWNLNGFETCPFHREVLFAVPDFEYRAGNWPPTYEGPPPPSGYDHRARQAEDGQFETYLLQRLGLLSQGAAPLLDLCPLSDVIWYCGMLGRALRNPVAGNRPRRRPGDYQAGFEALRFDREVLAVAIGEWVKTYKDDIKAVTSEEMLGWTALINTGRNAAYTRTLPLLGQEIVLAQTIACRRTGIVGNRRLIGSRVRIWPIPRAQAARDLHVTETGMQLLERQAGLPPKTKFFWRKQFEILGEARRTAQDASAVAKRLGCQRGDVEALRRARVLFPILAARGSTTLVYLPAAVDEMLAKVRTSDGAESGVTLDAYARGAAITRHEAILKLVKGRILAVGPSASNIRFDTVRVQSPRSARRYGGKPSALGRRSPSGETMLRSEFAALTGFSPSAITRLMEQGVLSDDGGRIMPRRKALEFHRRYLNPNAFLREPMTRQRLRDLGIEPQFTGVQMATIVDRQQFESVTGAKTLPDEPAIFQLWGLLRQAAAEHAPSFVIPEHAGAYRMRIRTSASKCPFKIELSSDGFTFKRTFEYSIRFDWKAFLSERENIREAMKDFEWIETGLRVDAVRTARDQIEIEQCMRALGEVCDLTRFRMP
ncbi:hypothetical protein HGP14_13210 [Rhizobium sp. P32RR-XVIII]|uniref:TniQ family protein n=1 Tax=Rhizobium sp. P32RR-XVIII TaxID=2726738 RepID=UPI001456C869|nr:TniQ family protein [Rhizobium sp. P32RR-XVIII]NLS04314.1 hypothetical protein [Rhizobium sp. P32RR-XVIII]